MSEQKPGVQPPEPEIKKRRPLGLSVLLLFSFVYNGLLLLAMIAALFSVNIVQSILQQYYKHIYISHTSALMFAVTGTLIFGVSFWGLILLWKLKRKGFYFYASAQAVMLASLVFIFKSFDVVNIAIAALVIIIIGLYSKNMD
jgi:FtsH-binding integral membrane protein